MALPTPPLFVPTVVDEHTRETVKIFKILTESDIELLTTRFYDIGFSDKVSDELMCIQCERLAIPPYVASCNHKFCCCCRVIRVSGDDGDYYNCPKCKIQDEEEITKRDPVLELRILVLRACCPNYEKGCKHVSTLMELPGHIRECDQTIDLDRAKILPDALKEPNAFKQYLEGKISRLENRFSLLQETMTIVLSKEFKILNKAIEGQKSNFDDHLRVIDEAFREVNDRFDFTKRPAIDSDIMDNDPFKKRDEILKKRQLSFFQENFKSTDFQPLKCFIPPTSTVFTWVINNVSKALLADDQEYFKTVTFQLNDHPVLLQAEFRFPNGHLSSQFRKPLDKSLSDWLVPPYPRVTYSIGVSVNQKIDKDKIEDKVEEEKDVVIKVGPSTELDQVMEEKARDEEIKAAPSEEPDLISEEQKSDKKEEIKAEPSVEPDHMPENQKIDEEDDGEAVVIGEITVVPSTEPYQVSDIPYAELEEIAHVTEIAYKEQREKLQVDWYNCCFGRDVIKRAVQNDSLTITICVDFPHLLEKPASMNGVFCWQLPHFTESIKNAKGKHDIRYSPYFYTGERGVRMQAQLNDAYALNCFESPNPHLQPIPLMVRCLTGEFDASVPDDIELSVTVGVLDGEENIIPMSQEVSRNATCELQLLTLEQMKIYLKDDVLRILITVVGYE